MRRFVWTLLALLVACPIAHADCEREVREALAKLRTSGPFHFVIQQWNRNFLRQTSGRLVPGKARHVVATMQNGSPGGEEIIVGKQSWQNDGLGWVEPWSTFWSHEDLTPDFFKIVEGSCSATEDGPEWARVKEYTFNGDADATDARIDTTPSAVRVVVDKATSLIVRYERMRDARKGVSSVIATYRHDASIRIEAPVVDLERRKANALAAFNKEVEATDQACRAGVARLLQAGVEGLPFKYEIKGGPWAGVWGMHGTFVPPHSIHNMVVGVPYHGGGSEYIEIGADAWMKGPSQEWRKAAKASVSPLSGVTSASWTGPLFFDDVLTGSVSHVGRAQCPSPGGETRSPIDYYEYDLYRDTSGGRVRVATQRMYADGTRPVKLETIGTQGRVMQVQTRTYLPGLVIEPPTAPAK